MNIYMRHPALVNHTSQVNKQESTSPSLISAVLCSGFQVLVHSSLDTFGQTHAPRPRSCSVLYLAYCDYVISIMSILYMILSQNYIIPTDRFLYSAKDVLEEINCKYY
jgi:aminoglycoside N3'-acetyltransferase